MTEPRPKHLADYLPNLGSLALLALLAGCYFGTFADLDFTWQIRTGERIVELGQLRTPEAFSYTIPGKLVPDFEWLYEVVLWLVWSGFGFGGLKLLKVLLVVSTLLIVGVRLHREGVRPRGIAVALFVAVAILHPAWNLRPLYCTTIGLLLVSWLLHEHCTGKKPLSWWLPVIMCIWSNLHPGVITGQGLLLGAIGWEWINRWVRLNPPLTARACWRLTCIGGLAVAATFLSPDPIERLGYPFQPELAHPIQRIFVEMQPLYTFVSRPPYMIGLAYVVAFLVGLTVLFRFRHYRLWELTLLLGLAGLANIAIRSLQDWVLVMLALGVPHMVAVLRDAARAGRKRFWVAGLLRADRSCKRILSSWLLRIQPVWPALGAGALLVASLLPPLSRRMPFQDAVEWPAAAVARIEELGIQGRFFAPANYGSYLIWRLGDRARSYVDTRGFFFPPELIEDSQYLPQMVEDWRPRLDRVLDIYHTDFFLLEIQGPRGQLWRTIQPHAGTPLFLDDDTVLLAATQVRQGIERWERATASAR